MRTQHSADERAAFPAAELEQYRGQWVAFAADGSRILASGKDEIEASEAAEALGHSAAEFVLEPIPERDTLLV